MPTCAEELIRTLRDAGVTRMFGLPGGEILDVVEAARRAGLAFLLTRHEATASFMADATGQLTRRPGVCVSTLGPGAINMSLGVANAYLDRSPLVAITAALARAKAPVATHQDLDLNAVYRPFTKLTITLDGEDTAAKVQHALAVATSPRMGPVHIAVPSDVAREADRAVGAFAPGAVPAAAPASASERVAQVADAIARASRPVVILGLDINPQADVEAVRAFVEALGAPVFSTPKAKGVLPEDHPLFYGVCAGVSGDAVVVEYLSQSDLLVGVGFDPVESDKVWHATMPLVALGPVSIAAGTFRPSAEAVGDLRDLLPQVAGKATSQTGARRLPSGIGGSGDRAQDRAGFRARLEAALRPAARPIGLSGYELTLKLRALFPRDTILATDVGSVKMVTTQAWSSYAPLTLLESNGLSAMSYSLPAAMAARLQFPDRPVLCTIGDGGFGMTMADIETCVRERLHFVTVVFNDNSLSLIDVAQARRGYPTCGVRYGAVDFAAAAAAMGAWARRVESMDALESAVRDAQRVDRPAVLDVVVDPSEYHAQTRLPASRP